MIIHGKWHNQGSAAQLVAALHIEDDDYLLEIDGGRTYSGELQALQVSDRLGNVERKITLEDGSIFASQDNDAIDGLFKDHNKVNGFIHAIESHIGLVAIALLLTVTFAFSFFKWGVPWASTKIAHALPQKTNELIAGETLKFLDKYMFEESELDAEKIEQIREHFKSTLIPLDEKNNSINYRLHFREWNDGEKGIPNALALPSGDIILTDEFVKLSENQDEIDAVLLHEMGHVVRRHTLEMVIETAFVTTAVMMITGDNNGLADMGTGLGSLLVSTNYSRNHETEADLYAFQHMLVAKIDPKAFSSIMQRITSSMEDTNESNKTDDNLNSDTDDGWLDYLSSHPSTTERIKQAELYSECFQAGLVICDAENVNNKP